jgi:uncharacterized protein (DUF302 family)
MTANLSVDGLITLRSPYPVFETLDRLEALLRLKSVKIFTRVDHSGEAQNAGLSMPPTQVLIFGNPKGGTPVMLANPLSAIDLPLKALAWQDTAGKVWLTWNDPQYLKSRYNLSDQILAPLVTATSLIAQALT